MENDAEIQTRCAPAWAWSVIDQALSQYLTAMSTYLAATEVTLNIADDSETITANISAVTEAIYAVATSEKNQ